MLSMIHCVSAFSLYIKYIDKILFLIENRITSKPIKYACINKSGKSEKVHNLRTSMPYIHSYVSQMACTLYIVQCIPNSIFYLLLLHSIDHLVVVSSSFAHSLTRFYSTYYPKTKERTKNMRERIKKCVLNIIFANLKNRSIWVI